MGSKSAVTSGRPPRCSNTTKLLTQAILALLALAVFRNYEDEITLKYGSEAARAKVFKRRAKERAAAAAAAAAAAGRPAHPPPPVLSEASRYLILAEPDRGRYSHSRLSLLEGMALASVTGRTLITRPLSRECSSPLDRLFHTGADLGDDVSILGDEMFPSYDRLCGGSDSNNLFLWVESSPLYPPLPEPTPAAAAVGVTAGAAAGPADSSAVAAAGGDAAAAGGGGDDKGGDGAGGRRRRGGSGGVDRVARNKKKKGMRGGRGGKRRGGGSRGGRLLLEKSGGGHHRKGDAAAAAAAPAAAAAAPAQAAPAPVSAAVAAAPAAAAAAVPAPEPTPDPLFDATAGSIPIPRADDGTLGRGKLTWRGVTWSLLPAEDLPIDPADLDAANATGAVVERWQEGAPWSAYFPPAFRGHIESVGAADLLLPLRLRALGRALSGGGSGSLPAPKCVVLHSLYHSFAWPAAALTPAAGAGAAAGSLASASAFERVASFLEPSPSIEAAVRHWFAAQGLAQHGPLGLHLRLRNSAFGPACAADPAGVVRVLARLQEALLAGAGDGMLGDEGEEGSEGGIAAAFGDGGAVGGNASAPLDPAAVLSDTTLLLATDDAEHACTRGVTAAFPGRVVLAHSGGVLAAEECTEAGFQQEVLGRTSGFVGVGSSMFSTTVHWIRALRFGHPARTTVFL